MKANPGGAVTGDAILGREDEISEMWAKLEKRSVILSAERRVGKTSVLRKMCDHPAKGWIPLFCFVEAARHPIDCVEKIFAEANQLEARSGKGVLLGRIRSAYQKVAGTEISGWKLPPLQSDWKRLLNELMADISECTDNKVVIILDEFPHMISNIIDDHGGAAGMEFLDTLREIRQKFEPTNQIRFLLSGSIGLHLILQQLKSEYGYKGNPTNNMAWKILAGMTDKDVRLMCRKYLDEENIARNETDDFDKRMAKCTDGLPIYIQHICERFQDSNRQGVTPEDIDLELRELMDSREIEWFRNTAERIETYYKKLNADQRASDILKMLSHKESFVQEKAIIDYIRSQMTVEHDSEVVSTLELLLDDNYLDRDTSTGERRYRFKYDIMRRWWKINRG
ncbi:MAG: ATP-binding protein [Deltaproteobacteria bacterium]|nr:ATP-binding protein [Deltaproteobacteria bacterium]